MIFENLDRLESSIGGDIIPQAKITYQVEVLNDINLFIKNSHKLIEWYGIFLRFLNSHQKFENSFRR